MRKLALWVVLLAFLPMLVFVRSARAWDIQEKSDHTPRTLCQAGGDDSGSDDGDDEEYDDSDDSGNDSDSGDYGDDDNFGGDMEGDYDEEVEE